MSNLWEVWEWDDKEDNDALIYQGGEDLTYDELPKVVEREITRIYSEIGEDCIPYEAFSHGGIDSDAKNIIYDLPPNETVAPDTFKLMRMCNGDVVFGLTAWRKGKNLAYLETIEEY